MKLPCLLLLLVPLLLAHCSSPPAGTASAPAADLLLENGRIWTGDPTRPWAEWVAVSGDRILALGDGSPGVAARRRIDLQGRLTVPGFNDSHVHFASAGALLTGVNLLAVSDDEGLTREIEAATGRLPAGSWITGGNWGAYEAWEIGSDGRKRGESRYVPSRAVIDGISRRHPVLITRFDGKMGLANAAALLALQLESETGILEGEELAAARQRVPEKPRAQRLAETRRGLEECREWGVTSVQDMSPAVQVEVYRQLAEQGELTCRIHFSPSRLVEWQEMKEKGWTVGAGDEWIRFGTIKTHVDGIMGGRTARFFEPYADNPPDQPDWRGGWREFSRDLSRFEEMLALADEAGIQLRVHAIGDEANALLLDMLERMEVRNGPRDRRFRLVHAQVIRPRDFDRLEGRGLVAEVQPYHCTDDMRWMEERIGAERCRGAYCFRSLAESGCVLAFGSDWPGTQASYYPVNPILGLYAAVTRQTVKGTPPEGWFPGERVTLEAALRAYTRGSAYASFEENIKGTLREGMLADLAVLDTDLFQAPPREWLDARVDLTVVGGKIVFRRARS